MRIPIDTVLLVIDMQEAIDDPCWGSLNNPGADGAAAALLAVWRGTGMPVVHVRHDCGAWRRPTARAGVARLQGAAAPRIDEPVIGKHTGSAFVGTDLEERLTAQGWTTLVALRRADTELGGKHGEARGVPGVPRLRGGGRLPGLGPQRPVGRDWPAEAVHALSLAAMAGEYADITTTSQACAAATLISSRAKLAGKRGA